MWTPSLACFVLAVCASAQSPKHGVGRTPTEQEIRALGITVAPDGAGLPEGSGSAVEGRALLPSAAPNVTVRKAKVTWGLR